MQSEPSIRKLQQEIYRGNLARLRSEVFDFGYDAKLLTQQISITKVLQAKIRQMYLMAGVHPFHFCSYATFAKVFPPPNIHEAYKAENLNIIDLHLRYHQYIHEKLTLFKWVPSLVVLAITRFNPIGLVFPLVYTHAVDYYFSDFLTWKYSRDKIINIRGEFTPKLSKQRNILRRVLLFNRLKEDLAKDETQIPKKYMKFGQNTHYIFHTADQNIQQSSIYLTPIFQAYMGIKTASLNSLAQITKNVSKLLDEFKQYKKIQNKKQLPIFMDRAYLLKYKDINKEEIYNLSKQVQLRIRRFLEIVKYAKSGKVFMSGFTFTDMLHFNKHFDLLAPHKYNYESNVPDLVILYGTVITFSVFKFIIKRAIKM